MVHPLSNIICHKEDGLIQIFADKDSDYGLLCGSGDPLSNSLQVAEVEQTPPQLRNGKTRAS